MRKELNPISSLVFILALILSVQNAVGQTTRPRFTNAAGTSLTDRICVRPATATEPLLDQRIVRAQGTERFPAGTVFTLELSDETGTFPTDNVRVLTEFTLAVEIPSSGGLIEFPSFVIPSDLRSDDFRMRIRFDRMEGSPNDRGVGQTNNSVSIFFYDSTERVEITGPNPNSRIVALCAGETATLTVSPTNLPNYQWFFNGAAIPGATGTSIEVTEPGDYEVVAEFGSCNDEFRTVARDDVVLINFDTTPIVINGGLRQEFCPSDVKILTTTITPIAGSGDLDYEWTKDGELIVGENRNQLELPQSNFAGIYAVRVIGTNTCDANTDPVEVINLGSNILTQPPPEIVLLPTQPPITLEITTDAPPGSTIEWFRDGVSIEGAPVSIADPGALSIEVSTSGVYRADVFANDFCMDTLSAETVVYTTNNYSIQIGNVLDCEENTGTLGIENIFGEVATVGQIPLTVDQYSFFAFEWFRNGTSTGDTGTTLAVTESDVGDIYVLEGTLTGSGISTISSNELTVEILSDTVEIESFPENPAPDQPVTLSVTDNASFMYQWFLNSEPIADATSSSIEVTERGTYTVQITLSDCIIESAPFNFGVGGGVSELIPNVITPDGSFGRNDSWKLPESFNSSDVEVTIYNSRGKLDFQKSGGYNGDWPTESASNARELIYYYIITRNNEIVRKGTITVLR
ncbi:T9SS type B sorting domain-containing protein [Aquimarina algicola]|uniref:Gliding motility-associated C-terminal domain-containing protein n=1 Tax=Aquimarina algicola TaxID=2589995 RepID=A0A504JN62_9FLAO|nr:gliding motility-associated C-terminal domain-containing protein [Aquimarina algicola]TPN87850.1 hypothetical protein FHK87_09765 [Aquimarina algicola]